MDVRNDILSYDEIETSALIPKKFDRSKIILKIEGILKRMLDIFGGICGVVMLIPLTIGVWLANKLSKDKGPIFYTQERIGQNGKIFKMYKFRTMTNERASDGRLLSDKERLTPFGILLRSSSLDELPELVNILKGDCSIVGPRPLLVSYLPRYNSYQARRHEVRPGFTGYAQVHGRNAISWEEKFDYDVKYVDNITFLGDWHIIFQTLKVVFKREGISSKTSVTMEEFMGSPNKQDDKL